MKTSGVVVVRTVVEWLPLAARPTCSLARERRDEVCVRVDTR